MVTGKLFDRAVVIVLDSVGAGELPDAAKWGDAGSDTLGSLVRKYNLAVPNLAKLGLSRCVKGLAEPAGGYTGASGRMAELSNGKDTLVGHWEMVGVISDKPFETFPEGFPGELIAQFERETGRGVIGNKVASGTDIIQELGALHVRTGELIVYTSADSVFQIAAHEDVVSLDELYAACKIACKILKEQGRKLARVIARPFVGDARSGFERTPNRHDYAVNPPPSGMLLDRMREKGLPVVGVGKIKDIFDGVGITESFSTKSNLDGIDRTVSLETRKGDEAILFVNLVDFDMLYGHRRDPVGYKRSLEELDAAIPRIVESLGPRDALFITADHGNDPTYRGTDHTREHVPLVIAGKTVKPVDLGTRRSFADLGATLGENFSVPVLAGESFLGAIG
jgi:phosphopentomutase